MNNPPPDHLVITLSIDRQDSRLLFSERRLKCSGCGRTNPAVEKWVLPGLCNECALYVSSVSPSARLEEKTQQTLTFLYPD